MSCAFVRAFMHHPALTLAESMEAPRECASDDRMIYRSDMESPYCILHNLRAWERDPGGVNDTLGAIKLCTFGAPGSARRVSRVCKGITYSRDVSGIVWLQGLRAAGEDDQKSDGSQAEFGAVSQHCSLFLGSIVIRMVRLRRLWGPGSGRSLCASTYLIVSALRSPDTRLHIYLAVLDPISSLHRTPWRFLP